MNQRLAVLAFLSCTTVAGTVDAEFPPEVNIAFEVMAEKGYTPTQLSASQILEIEGVTKSERLERSGVELYEVNRAIPGLTDMMPDPNSIPGFGDGTGVAEYFEVVSVELDGGTIRFARGVPPEEIGRRKVEAGGMTREQFANFLELYSDGLLVVGAAFRQQVPILGQLGGSPSGVLGGLPSDTPVVMPGLVSALQVRSACVGMLRHEDGEGPRPSSSWLAGATKNSWLSPDPLTFFTGPACMLQYGAAVMRATDLTEEQKKAAIAQAREATNDRIQLGGREEVDGRPTRSLEMNDLDLSQTTEDGAQIDIDRAMVWIDEEYFVRRKMRLEGIMHAEGESREFFMESLYQDYRNVPDSQLYEPYRTVIRTGGMMTPEQQREMQKAMAELEDYDREMAKMPAAQRAMVERMMGDKIKQARSLATGGAVEFEMLTSSIVINPDFSAAPSLLDEDPDTVAQQSAQQTCLQERIAERQEAQKKKRGIGRLMRAVSRTGSQNVGREMGDIYSANQSADDLAATARDLGVTEDEIAVCENPPDGS